MDSLRHRAKGPVVLSRLLYDQRTSTTPIQRWRTIGNATQVLYLPDDTVRGRVVGNTERTYPSSYVNSTTLSRVSSSFQNLKTYRRRIPFVYAVSPSGFLIYPNSSVEFFLLILSLFNANTYGFRIYSHTNKQTNKKIYQ